MQLNQFVSLKELFACVRSREDRELKYSVYWKDGADNPELDDNVLLAEPVAVKDDRDLFPQIVTDNGYWILCSKQTIQDVVEVALEQNPNVSDETLRTALFYYLSVDNFMDVTES